MRFRNLAVFGSIVLSLAACDVSSIQVAETQTAAIGPKPPAMSVSDCPAGYECKDAIPLGGVAADPGVLGANCPEACMGRGGGGVGLSVTQDADPTWFDVVNIRCANNSLVAWPSTHPCWDCQQSCAGASCPPGAECVTIPKSFASDCRAYKCDEGWTPVVTGGFQPPTCWRALSSNSPPAPPSTTATTVNRNPRLSWGAAVGAASYNVYRQVEWMAAPDFWSSTSDTFYEDGSTIVSGPPQGSPPAGKWVRYYVVSVSAAGVESSYATHHYYPYTGIVPY